MRFLCLYKPNKKEGAPPTPDDIAKMGQLIEEMTKAGVLLATEGCLPSAKGARVRLAGGKYTVTDGPFTETKELIAGFWLIQVKSKQEALEWARRIPFTEGEEVEIRQIFELEDFGPSEAVDRHAKIRDEIRP